jgi:hypothetical protein
VVVYRVKLTTTDIPGKLSMPGRVANLSTCFQLSDVPSTLGAVATIEWYPYGHVFAVAWQKRGVALFSTYGAQIWLDIGEKTVCRLGVTFRFHNICYEFSTHRALYCSSIDWGAEGHQLWFVNNHTLQMYSTVRAANVNNPSMVSLCVICVLSVMQSFVDTVCLYSSTDVYIAPVRTLEASAHAPHAVWRLLPVPHAYMAHAWPLRVGCAAVRARTHVHSL